MIYILNFGHPLHPRVVASLAPAKTVRVPFALDLDRCDPTPVQIVRIVREAGRLLAEAGGKLDGTDPVAVVLPGLSEGVALLLAELHGRLGAFPRILALRRQDDGTFGLAGWGWSAPAGLVDLESLRQEARGRR